MPLRPLWLCRACADPWPCANARLSLKAEYAQDRTSLCVYLGSMLYDACEDLTSSTRTMWTYAPSTPGSLDGPTGSVGVSEEQSSEQEPSG